MSLHDGANDFAVRAFDKVSNAADATISVTRDSQAPAVHINLPADGARLNVATVTVSGTVDQEAGLTLTVNGVAATITAGTFSAASVPLVEGNNTLIARVTDSVGNQGTHTRVVVRDTVLAQQFAGVACVPLGRKHQHHVARGIEDAAHVGHAASKTEGLHLQLLGNPVSPA